VNRSALEVNRGAPDDDALLAALGDTKGPSSRAVFGATVVQDGTAMVPVARITCATSGGEHELSRLWTARPLGALVVSGGKARWLPAVDVNKVVLGGQLVAIATMITAWIAMRARTGSSRRPSHKGRCSS